MRLNAILYNACVFVHEYKEKGPIICTYYHVQPTNEYVDHVTGIVFRLYLKLLIMVTQSIGMLTARMVVLEFEGFRSKHLFLL